MFVVIICMFQRGADEVYGSLVNPRVAMMKGMESYVTANNNNNIKKRLKCMPVYLVERMKNQKKKKNLHYKKIFTENVIKTNVGSWIRTFPLRTQRKHFIPSAVNA